MNSAAFPVNRALAEVPLVGILRAPTAQRFAAAADVLVDAGFRAIEFTLTTRGVLDALSDYAGRKPDGVYLGAGTVLTADDARRAVNAGADFLVSPVVDAGMITEANRLRVAAIPGAFTATEIYRARQAGASVVKVFPCGPVGPAYLKALRGPLPDIPLLPTGDIAISDVAAYLAAGAVGIGLGSPLLGDAADPDGDLGALAARAKTAVESTRR